MQNLPLPTLNWSHPDLSQRMLLPDYKMERFKEVKFQLVMKGGSSDSFGAESLRLYVCGEEWGDYLTHVGDRRWHVGVAVSGESGREEPRQGSRCVNDSEARSTVQ